MPLHLITNNHLHILTPSISCPWHKLVRGAWAAMPVLYLCRLRSTVNSAKVIGFSWGFLQSTFIRYIPGRQYNFFRPLSRVLLRCLSTGRPFYGFLRCSTTSRQAWYMLFSSGFLFAHKLLLQKGGNFLLLFSLPEQAYRFTGQFPMQLVYTLNLG